MKRTRRGTKKLTTLERDAGHGKDDLLERVQAVSDALAQKEITADVAEISMIAQDSISLDSQTLPKVLSLLEKLEDHDDVQNVHSDLDIPDEVMTQMTD